MAETFQSLAGEAGQSVHTVLEVTVGATIYYWSDEDIASDEIEGGSVNVEGRILSWGDTLRGLGENGKPALADLTVQLDNSDGALTGLFTSQTTGTTIVKATARLIVGFPTLGWSLWIPACTYEFAGWEGGDVDYRLTARWKQSVDTILGSLDNVPTVKDIWPQLGITGTLEDEAKDLYCPVLFGNFVASGNIPAISISRVASYDATSKRGTAYLVGLHPYDSSTDPSTHPAAFYYTEEESWGKYRKVIYEGTDSNEITLYWISVTHNAKSYKAIVAFWYVYDPSAGLNGPAGSVGAAETVLRMINRPSMIWVAKFLKAGYDSGGGTFDDSQPPARIVTPVGICEALVKHYSSDGAWDGTTVDTATMQVLRSRCKRLGYDAMWLLDGPKGSAAAECFRVLASFAEPFITRDGKLSVMWIDPSVIELVGGFSTALEFNDDGDDNIEVWEEWYPSSGQRWAMINEFTYTYGGAFLRRVIAAATREGDLRWGGPGGGSGGGAQSAFLAFSGTGRSLANSRRAAITGAIQDSKDLYGPMEGKRDFESTTVGSSFGIARDYTAARLHPRPMRRIVTSDLRILEKDFGEIIKVKHDASLLGNTEGAFRLCVVEGIGYDPTLQQATIICVDMNSELQSGFFILGNETEWNLDSGTTVDLTQSGPDVLIHFDAVPTDAATMTTWPTWQLIVGTAANKKVFQITSKTDSQNYTAAAQTCTNESNIAEGSSGHQARHSYESAKSAAVTASDSDANTQLLTIWGHLCDVATEQFTDGDDGKWLNVETV